MCGRWTGGGWTSCCSYSKCLRPLGEGEGGGREKAVKHRKSTHLSCSYLEDNGGALAVGWVGGASSSKKGLSVYIRDDKIMKIWLASDVHVLLTLIFTHHRLTLVCANEAPIYTKKKVQFLS